MGPESCLASRFVDLIYLFFYIYSLYIHGNLSETVKIVVTLNGLLYGMQDVVSQSGQKVHKLEESSHLGLGMNPIITSAKV